jgi:hypothetical protein
MKVICTRNNAEFEFVRMEGEDYVLADPETGKEKIINAKAYKRFYKEVEEPEDSVVDEEVEEETESEDVEDEEEVEEAEEEETPKEEPKPKKASAKEKKAASKAKEPKPKKASAKEKKAASKAKEPKPKKVKEPKAPREISPLKDIVEKIVLAADCTIFETQVKGFHTFKVAEHMCMAMTFSTKGVVLWLRTKVLKDLDLGINYKPMKHMFDARLPITEVTDENVDLIRKLVAAHVEYQKGINKQRAEKVLKQEAARKKREEKAEAKKKEEMAKKLGVKSKKSKKEEKVEEPVEAEVEESEDVEEEE